MEKFKKQLRGSCHAELDSASINVGVSCRHSNADLQSNFPSLEGRGLKGWVKKVSFAKQTDTVHSLFTTHHSLKKTAFTLAEVLITLGIIGIVAALTMPSLIQKHEEHVTANKLKKFYSTFSQAYLMAVNDYGTFDTWGLGGPDYDEPDENGKIPFSEDYIDRVDKFFDMMKPYLNIVHHERQAIEYDLDSTGTVLADGSRIVSVWLKTPNCIEYPNAKCGDFYVNINGKKKYDPNNNKNVFNFVIYPNKIVPSGAIVSEFNACKNKTYPAACTAWVIYNGNMDYLHCPEKLSWNGKHSCK